MKKEQTQKFTALGRRVTQFEGLDTFDCPPEVEVVELVSDECTAVCPITGQPDWYRVKIRYAPDQKCVESKTVKLYLQSYRNKGLFCEAFANRILEDFKAALDPLWIEVTVEQKPRGGVSICAVATSN